MKNISDVEGFEIAYNTPSGQYIYGNTLYLSGTRNIYPDAHDDSTIPFNMIQHSQTYRDTENLLNYTPGITNIIGHALGGAVSQKITENYPDRNYNITTCGSPNLSISNKTPNNMIRYKNIGDPIASLDRGAKIIGGSLNPFEAHYFSNSPHISGNTGGWIIGDTSQDTPWNPETSIYTTPPKTQENI